MRFFDEEILHGVSFYALVVFGLLWVVVICSIVVAAGSGVEEIPDSRNLRMDKVHNGYGDDWSISSYHAHGNRRMALVVQQGLTIDGRPTEPFVEAAVVDESGVVRDAVRLFVIDDHNSAMPSIYVGFRDPGAPNGWRMVWIETIRARLGTP